MELISDVFTKLDSYEIQSIEPFGIALIAKKSIAIDEVISGDLLKEFVKTYRLVLLRGFQSIEKIALVNYAESMGPLLEWEFGKVMEMRVHEKPTNYLFTHGPVPFHWDGAFHHVPRFLMFHCIEAPAVNAGGETLFTDTTRIWQEASIDEKRSWLDKQISYQTEKLAHYGGQITQRLVQKHPETGEVVLRYAENVPSTMLNPVDVWVEEVAEHAAADMLATLAKRCYQPEYCYTHVWQRDDFILADNHALVHGRNAFSDFSPRHLRRIQVM